MKKLITFTQKNILYFVTLLLFIPLAGNGQIHGPEGINMPGQWNGWTNPPSTAALASEEQAGGDVRLRSMGIPHYHTTIHAASSGGDITGGTYEFLFTSGSADDYYNNKWGDVTVSLDQLQSYTNGGANNTVTVTNDMWYTVNMEDKGYENTSAIFMATSAAPVSIADVSRQTPSPSSSDEVSISITTSAEPSQEENVYVRYTTDDWSSSSLVEANFTDGSGTATIPAQADGTTIEYYVFTTTVSTPTADYDLYTLRYANNGGSNYSYTVSDDPVLTMTDDGLITEGSEDGEIITVNLKNDQFVASLNTTNWTVSNLPSGVSKGGLNRINDTQAELALSGDTTGDYDTDITNMSVEVAAAELVTSSAALTANTGVTFNAIVEGGDPISLSDDGEILEGAESGEIITVDLVNGTTYESSIDPAQIAVNNLPVGVSKGSVTRTDNTRLSVALSGNSAREYHTDISNVQVVIQDSEIAGYSGDALSSCTGVTMQNTGVLIQTDQDFPTPEDALDITFDATQGNAALAGESTTVYAHTGVTINGNNWQNSSDWLDNASKYELTSLGNDKYELVINDVQNYYGLTAGEESSVTALNFVFRNGDGSIEAKAAGNADIMLPLYTSGLDIKLHSPEGTPVVNSSETVHIVGASDNAETMTLYQDGSEIYSACGNRLEYSLNASATKGSHTLTVEAANASETVTKETSYFTRGDVNVQNLPSGVQDGINYIDDQTVTLVLHAPYKEDIFVLGDFNNWEINNSYQMKRTHADPDNTDNRYWITINGLTPDTEYAFQYLIDGEMQVADPYTEKVLDPSNDQYIRESTYPNLRDYPEKGEGIVSTMHPGKQGYEWEVSNFTREAKDRLVIYELHFRDFTNDGKIGNIKEAMQKLDYLEAMGINAIELMPINEFESNNSWGYDPSFYFASDKAYGTEEMYKKFIDEAHKRGMAVIGDIVLNHSFYQSPMVQMYFNDKENRPAANNPWFNETHNFENEDLQWGADFDHESSYVVDFVDRVMEHWLNEYKLDGFRFDFTKGFSNNYKSLAYDKWGSNEDADRIANLKAIYDMMKNYDSESLMICEHLAEDSEEKALADYGMLMWSNMEHNYAKMALGNTSSASDIGGADYNSKGFQYPNLVPYMESHDEQRINYKLGKDSDFSHDKRLNRIAMAASFLIPLKGPKMMWQFQELGYDISINENGRTGKKPVKWDYYDDADRRDLYEHFSLLINAKRNNDVFLSDDYNFHVNDGDGYGKMKRLAMYTDGGNDVVIIANISSTNTGSIVPNFSETGTWYDVVNGGTITVSDLSNAFQLQPGEFRIYSLNPLKLEGFWIGKGNNNYWHTPDNWSIGQVPNSNADVVIPDSATVSIAAGESAVCNTLTQRAASSLTVESNADLTVSNDLTLEADEDGKAALVDKNSGGAVTVNGTAHAQYHLPNNRWWYLAPNVSPANAGADLQVDQSAYRLFQWTENNGGSDGWMEQAASTDLTPMEGYAYLNQSNETVTATFSGSLNTGSYSSGTLTRSSDAFKKGFHLLGNPYPSHINWGSENNPASGITKNNLNTTLWVRKDGNFATYNWSGDGTATNAGSPYIAPGQAFWVLVDDQADGSLSLDNSNRTASSQPMLKARQNKFLRLKISSGNYSDETVVGFWEKAETGYERYDSRKMFATDERYPQLYTPVEDKKLAINGMPLPSQEKTIPLGFKASQEGTFRIKSIHLPDIDNIKTVYLKDNQNGNLVNLQDSPEYRFTSSGGENTADRFSLLFKISQTSGADAPKAEGMHIFSHQRSVYLQKHDDPSPARIRIYNSAGQKILDKQASWSGVKRLPLSVQAGLYLVEVHTINGISKQKIMLK